MPDVRFYPSAVVAFRPVAAQRLKLQFYLIGVQQGILSRGPTYLYAQPPTVMPKVPMLPMPVLLTARAPFVQSREEGRVIATEPSPVWTNEGCRFPVPAGLELTLELRGHQSGAGTTQPVSPAVLARQVTLKPGEVFDAGEINLETGGPPPEDGRK